MKNPLRVENEGRGKRLFRALLSSRCSTVTTNPIRGCRRTWRVCGRGCARRGRRSRGAGAPCALWRRRSARARRRKDSRRACRAWRPRARARACGGWHSRASSCRPERHSRAQRSRVSRGPPETRRSARQTSPAARRPAVPLEACFLCLGVSLVFGREHIDPGRPREPGHRRGRGVGGLGAEETEEVRHARREQRPEAVAGIGLRRGVSWARAQSLSLVSAHKVYAPSLHRPSLCFYRLTRFRPGRSLPKTLARSRQWKQCLSRGMTRPRRPRPVRTCRLVADSRRTPLVGLSRDVAGPKGRRGDV